MTMALRYRVLAVGLALICVAPAVAQDWSQWRGPDRDGRVAGFTAPETWPEELTREWTVEVGLGDAPPVVVKGKLYLFARQGDQEVTMCLDASTGEEIWRNQHPAANVTGATRGHAGPRSSPAVANGKIVTLSVGGVLSCLDAETGAVIWREEAYSDVVPAYFTSMSPLIVDGMCIAHLGGKDDGPVVAYDLATGNQKWKWTGDGPAYSSPALMTVDGAKQLVTMTEKSVVGLAVADGSLLWRVPFEVGQRSTNSSTPIVDGQRVIFGGAGRGTTAVSIEKDGNGFRASEVWRNEELGVGFNTPVLVDGLLFGISDPGKFFCMNAEDGREVWIDDARQERFSAIVSAGSVMFALPSNSDLIVYEPNREQFRQLARYKVSDSPTYAHLVISGNGIYVKDKETIARWTIE